MLFGRKKEPKGFQILDFLIQSKNIGSQDRPTVYTLPDGVLLLERDFEGWRFPKIREMRAILALAELQVAKVDLRGEGYFAANELGTYSVISPMGVRVYDLDLEEEKRHMMQIHGMVRPVKNI